jgi:hypothetical protein
VSRGGAPETAGLPESEVSIPRWRIAAGCVVLAGLLLFAASVGPLYVRNLQLQTYVGDITRRVENQTKPDGMVRAAVLEKAHGLGLPVTAENVLIIRSPEKLRIEVRYMVRVNLPLY